MCFHIKLSSFFNNLFYMRMFIQERTFLKLDWSLIVTSGLPLLFECVHLQFLFSIQKTKASVLATMILLSFLAYLPHFETKQGSWALNKSRVMQSPCCVCVCVCACESPPPPHI
jgi:hypothetical protein